MGFFSKLFSLSDNSQNQASQTYEDESNVDVPVMDDKSESPFSDFFGINMLQSPNKDWKLTDVIYDVNRQMKFEKDIILELESNRIFNHCSALVIGDKFTNFFFEAPYDYNILEKAFFFVERNFVDKSTSMLRTTMKYENEMKEYNYDPSLNFDVQSSSFCIQYMRNRSNGNIIFVIRTSFCNKELDYDKLEQEFNNTALKDISSNESKLKITNSVNDPVISNCSEENRQNPEPQETTPSEHKTDDSISKIYVPSDDGSFIRASFDGNGLSFNDIIERLGIMHKLYYVWFTKDFNINICLKSFSKDIICLISNKDLGETVSSEFVKGLMEKDGYNYDNDFSIYSRESLLQDGIEGKFLTQDFMEEATHQKCMSNVLVDLMNGYTYIFENGILKAFTSCDGLVGQAKQMKNSNVFNIVKANAQKNYNNEQEVIKELNAQFKAYSKIPIDRLQIATSNSYNYCQYYLENCNPNVNLEEFLELTHDKAELLESTSAFKRYKYNSKNYTFDQFGNIISKTNTLKTRKAHLTANKNAEIDLDVIYSKDVNQKVSSICLEIECEDSAIKIAINYCQTKTQGIESKYFSLNIVGDKVIARDAYTHEYYFTTHSYSLANILLNGKQYLGSVTDIDISDATSPIFEISFIAVG